MNVPDLTLMRAYGTDKVFFEKTSGGLPLSARVGAGLLGVGYLHHQQHRMDDEQLQAAQMNEQLRQLELARMEEAAAPLRHTRIPTFADGVPLGYDEGMVRMASAYAELEKDARGLTDLVGGVGRGLGALAKGTASGLAKGTAGALQGAGKAVSGGVSGSLQRAGQGLSSLGQRAETGLKGMGASIEHRMAGTKPGGLFSPTGSAPLGSPSPAPAALTSPSPKPMQGLTGGAQALQHPALSAPAPKPLGGAAGQMKALPEGPSAPKQLPMRASPPAPPGSQAPGKLAPPPARAQAGALATTTPGQLPAPAPVPGALAAPAAATPSAPSKPGFLDRMKAEPWKKTIPALLAGAALVGGGLKAGKSALGYLNKEPGQQSFGGTGAGVPYGINQYGQPQMGTPFMQ